MLVMVCAHYLLGEKDAKVVGKLTLHGHVKCCLPSATTLRGQLFKRALNFSRITLERSLSICGLTVSNAILMFPIATRSLIDARATLENLSGAKSSVVLS